MDDLDRAEEQQAKALAAALTHRKPEGPPATGRCLYCEELTAKRWCSADCRTFFEEEQKLRKLRSL